MSVCTYGNSVTFLYVGLQAGSCCLRKVSLPMLLLVWVLLRVDSDLPRLLSRFSYGGFSFPCCSSMVCVSLKCSECVVVGLLSHEIDAEGSVVGHEEILKEFRGV